MPARLSLQSEDPEPTMEAESVSRKSHKKSKKEKRKHSERSEDKKARSWENGELNEDSTGESELKPPKAKRHRSEDNEGRDDRKGHRTEKNGVIKESKQKTAPRSSDDSSQYSEGEIEEELTPEQKEGAFSNFRISQETIELLKGIRPYFKSYLLLRAMEIRTCTAGIAGVNLTIPELEDSRFLLERGVTYLFPIQARTFNYIYDGNDCVAQARTGTGKTFSFAIPLVEKLQSEAVDRRRNRPPKVLVLAPTRELAIQVAKDFKDVTKKLVVSCFYGGTAYVGQ
eukprot:g42945.t1